MNTIQKAISENLKKYVKNNAMKQGGQTVTYGEVDSRSNKIMEQIYRIGIKRQSVIGVLMEDHIELIITMIGILKAGCIFMPLDPKYPLKRLEIMLHKTETNIVFIDDCTEKVINCIQEKEIRAINVKNIAISVQVNDMGHFNYSDFTEDDIIYIYFTSGTTGEPKAIAGMNKSLLHFVRWEISAFEIQEGIHISQFTPPCHDPFLRDIFVPLLSGGLICIPDNRDLILNQKRLIDWIQEERIELIHCIPGLFYNMTPSWIHKNYFSELKYILLAGERVIPQKIKKWFEIFGERIQLFNLYGPTETTLAKLYHRIEIYEGEGKNIPVGKPIDGARAIILDENNNICSKGEIGELLIRTPYRTLGYYREPDLTNQCFIQNLFSKDANDIIYKTGDLARVLSDGNIELIGRKDRQIKIRGFRVELDEVEHTIQGYPGITRSATDFRVEETDGESNIAAYYTADSPIDENLLRKYLISHLPEYMMPSFFLQLDELPMNSSGKINYRALPDKSNKQVVDGEDLPRDSIESKLVQIWSEVLGLEHISIYDNFFHLGGHSLKLMKLVSRIYQEFHIEVSLGEVFQSPTIESFVHYVKKSVPKTLPAIESKVFLEYYPLSSAQKRMFILYQMEPDSIRYNLTSTIKIKGTFSHDIFQYSMKELIKRHEIFRTIFKLYNNEPVQCVSPMISPDISYVDLTNEINPYERVKDKIHAFVRPFDLNKSPLIRILLLTISEEEHILTYDMPHIVTDGLSIEIMEKEFGQIYCGEQLPQLSITYKDYAYWQQEEMLRSVFRKQEDYWLNLYLDGGVVLNLPCDYKRPSTYQYEGRKYSFQLNREILTEIKKIGAQTNTTLYIFMLSALNILLYKYTGQEDIIIGSPVSGRIREELEKIVGMFANTLALRNYPKGIYTYMQFLDNVRGMLLKAYENQDYPFEELVNKLDVARDISRNPLFDVFLGVHNYDTQRVVLDDIQFEPYNMESNITKFDLSLYVLEEDENLECYFEYNTSLFREETIKRMSGHLEQIMNQVLSNWNIPLKNIELVTEVEKEQILFQFNNTDAPYPKDKLLHEIFEEQAVLTPNQQAVYFEEKSLTYDELNQKANQLAIKLREIGAGPEIIVGVAMERALDLMIGILGILKAGAAYLPINPYHPKERIEYMLRDSNTQILLVCQKDIKLFSTFNGAILLIDNLDFSQKYDKNLCKIAHANNAAYVIYTSGSSGEPKGVIIEHHSAVNRINWMQKEYKLDETDRILQKTPITFDVSVWELFWWYFGGSSVCLLFPNGEKDPEQIIETIEKYQITVIHFVPSMLNAFLDYLEADSQLYRISSLKKVFSSGEALSVKQVQRFYNLLYLKYGIGLFNLYGPTEAAVDVTFFDCVKFNNRSTIPIGKPIDNIKLYILDSGQTLAPIGYWGELYISGAGVGRGYLNNQELTSEKFLPDIFFDGFKMYRTGDIVRWLPEGEIEFIGRADNQVKIRGNRIELQEIEAVLLQHTNIKEAIVMEEKDKNGEGYLCSYVVLYSHISPDALQKFLSEKLPDYMIPSYFFPVSDIPITLNGKADKKALSSLKKCEDTVEIYKLPKNPQETVLSDIWCRVLGITNTSTNCNFFMQGGHSLKAIALSSEIHKALNVKIPISEIFKNPTIQQLTDYINKSKSHPYTSIQQVQGKEHYLVSSAQKRIYILSTLEYGQINYNMHNAILIEGNFSRERAEKIFCCLVQRHEVLRTTFHLYEGNLVQKIQEEMDFKMEYKQLERNLGPDELDILLKDIIKPFDLSKLPLFRVYLFQLSAYKHLLVYDMHHIISDGNSAQIIAKEFITLYNGGSLPELRIQYKDFTSWQNDRYYFKDSTGLEKTGLGLVSSENYWINQLSGVIPILNLPLDYKRPLKQSFEGDIQQFGIGKELSCALYETAASTGTTLYMVLLSVYTILLCKYTGQEEILVGCPVSGRYHIELDNMLGIFVNTIVLRNYISRDLNYDQYLKKIKTCCIEAYANQEYPFEKLVDKLQARRDLGRNPLFDTMLILQDYNKTEVDCDSLKFIPWHIPQKSAKFDLTLYATEQNGEIIFEFEYCTKLFKKKRIQDMISHFINIIKEIVLDKTIQISEIKFLSKEEEYRLINGINNTELYYEYKKTVHQLINDRVHLNPESTALIYKDERLTYKELNQKTNQLARALRRKGITTGSIVAFMITRSFDMIISMIGILKAGGAYLPIDADYPSTRIKYMLNDSKTKLLLTQKMLKHKLGFIRFDEQFNTEIFNLDDREWYQEDISDLDYIVGAENLAYIMYTSGSSGNPKGVMIEHKAINNFIQGMCELIDFSKDKKIIALTTISFDIFLLETLLPLAKGLQIVIADEEHQKDLKQLGNLIMKQKINMLQLTPSRLRLLIETGNGFCLKELSEIMIGGEALPEDMLKRLRELTNAKIYNMYGPTETTVWSTVQELTPKADITLGKPIANTQIYVLDQYNHLAFPGAEGEICISGDGLARGYLNQTELTNQKFLPHPFLFGQRMYRTGDLGRWREDGELEYLGRIDNQIKLRGIRMEPEEIQQMIKKCFPVNECIVTTTENNQGEKSLAAYYTSEREINTSDFRKNLFTRLPEYMIPEYYLYMNQMPLTPNGKLDRARLPGIVAKQHPRGKNLKTPSTKKESIMTDIWKRILNYEVIGVEDSFFDLGGNSLQLIHMHAEIEDKFGMKFDIADIFAHPSIGQLAAFLEQGQNKYKTITVEEAVILPEEYFTGNEETHRAGTIQFSLKKDIFLRLQHYSESKKIEVRDILLGLLISLFSELSQQNRLVIWGAEGNIVFPLEADLAKINTFDELFEIVGDKWGESNTLDNFRIDNSSKIIQKKKLNLVNILFVSNNSLFNIINDFDIIIIFNKNKKDHFNCEYDYQRLNKNRMEDLIYKYIDYVEEYLYRYSKK